MKLKTIKFTVSPAKQNTCVHRPEYSWRCTSRDSGDDDDDMIVPVFKCSKCSESYPTQRQLQRHKRRRHLKTRRRRRIEVTRRHWVDEGRVDGEREEDEDSSSSWVTATSSDGRFPEHSPQAARVVLKRLNFHHIRVSTPSKGTREVYYTAKESGSKYLQYRRVTFPALPKRTFLPPPPAVRKLIFDEDDILPKPAISVDKSLFLKMPDPRSYLTCVEGLKDDLHSVMDVITGHPMSTLTLEAYLTLLVSRYNTEINPGIRSSYQLRPISKTTFHLLPVFFLPIFGNRKKIPNNVVLEPNLKFLPKLPVEGDFVLIAPLLACHHFYLAIFENSTKTVYVYDSAWHYFSVEFRRRQVEQILGACFSRCPYLWTIVFRLSCAQQLDDSSCGCYAINFTENHLKGKGHLNENVLTKEEVKQIRYDIATELLPTTRYGKQLLEAITE